ncbi:ASCH/PUA domain-containing protein [Aeromonas salmonicida]
MKHELKIKPEYFAAIYFGEKTFEIRNNADRNFQVGDTLMLKAWDGEFTGDFVEKVVSYITDFEQKPGYVVLGLVNHREHELLEKFHRTGVAIERAISTGSVLADHPLKSRLELLANHHEREMELVAQLSDATRQCGVMAGLLCELRDGVEGEWCFPGNLDERIDAALAGKLPEPAMPESQQPKPCMPELDDNLRLILGRPNFSCITIAEALRLAGHAIERKAEHEQAAVIHWLLGFYFSHGDNWIDASKAALKDMRDTTMPQGGDRD